MVTAVAKYRKRLVSRNDSFFTGVLYVFLTISLAVVLYPLLYILSASFSDTNAVTAGSVWLFPVRPTLEGYTAVFEYHGVLIGYANSAYYTVVGTILNVAITLLAAYPLSRKHFYGRGFFMAVFTFTMLFNGGLIPTYLLVRSLGLLNTRWALIIPTAMGVWNVIIARTFLQQTIPEELYEAGEIDGCNDIQFLPLLVLPLSKPIIAVLMLFYGVWHWNSYFDALIYLRSISLYPLQIFLRNALVVNQVDPSMITDQAMLQRIQRLSELLKYSLIVVASLPMMLIYPFVQRYFVKGIMIGAIKG